MITLISNKLTPRRPHMNVNLGEMFDRFVAQLIESGHYQSQSEVIRDGLRLLKEKEELRAARLQQLRSEVDKGIKDIEDGNYKTYNSETLKQVSEEIKARGRGKLAGKKPKAA